MPLTRKRKSDRTEYLRRQLVKNKVDIRNQQNVWEWQEDHFDELNDEAGIAAFLETEREAEHAEKELEYTEYLESRDFTVTKN